MSLHGPHDMSARIRSRLGDLGALIGTLLVMELLLQLASAVSTTADIALSPPGSKSAPEIAPTVPDDRLGWRPNPAVPDHDKNGWRNRTALKRATLVALGDSQTYGTGVPREMAWSQQFSTLSGVTAYNMAYGGYGPLHSQILFDEALKLEPKVIIEAFYSGNDLFDCYKLVTDGASLANLRTTDESENARMRDADQVETLDARGRRLWSALVQPFSQLDGFYNKEGERGAIRTFLSRHSKVYGLLRAAKNLALDHPTGLAAQMPEQAWNAMKADALEHPQSYQVFEHGEIKTLFTAQYRAAGLDLADPRLAEGLRVALTAFQSMNERAAESGVHFVVLFIPTKEFAFEEEVAQSDATMGPVYDELVSNEQQMWARTREFCEEHEIDFVDALPSLREMLRKGTQPYAVSWDGHLTTFGHKAVAESVLSHLGQSPVTTALISQK
jgi:hypothetical protein